METDPPRLDGVEGMDASRFSPELLRISKLLEIAGDPIRLRILLSLHSAAKTTLDLVFEVPQGTVDGMSREIEFLRARGLVETTGSGSGETHGLTDLGRQLALVALSLGIDWPE